MKKCYLLLLSTVLLFFLFAFKPKEKTFCNRKFANTQYSYQIGNGTDRDLNFYMSADSLNWIQYTVAPNYQEKLLYDYDKMYFKVYTSHTEFVSYKLRGNATYKLYFNPAIKKFDLVYFDPVTNTY